MALDIVPFLVDTSNQKKKKKKEIIFEPNLRIITWEDHLRKLCLWQRYTAGRGTLCPRLRLPSLLFWWRPALLRAGLCSPESVLSARPGRLVLVWEQTQSALSSGF